MFILGPGGNDTLVADLLLMCASSDFAKDRKELTHLRDGPAAMLAVLPLAHETLQKDKRQPQGTYLRDGLQGDALVASSKILHLETLLLQPRSIWYKPIVKQLH
jgi:hypothetical protein